MKQGAHRLCNQDFTNRLIFYKAILNFEQLQERYSQAFRQFFKILHYRMLADRRKDWS